MAKEAIKKVKDNFSKNPRATLSLGAIGVAGLAAVIGVLTGTIEPDVAINLIKQALGLLALGG
ncbi:hypothetical protein ZZ1p0031 [Acinetobacter phage ZZ1]|jgi:hypothetical protein|nr:hypothetical protein ZZ1p0031 [Acinetobacter phage ZZ1]AFL47478.2 hypothetical protein ZZ1p0031 [Acinetobacter phage ZZ1]